MAHREVSSVAHIPLIDADRIEICTGGSASSELQSTNCVSTEDIGEIVDPTDIPLLDWAVRKAAAACRLSRCDEFSTGHALADRRCQQPHDHL